MNETPEKQEMTPPEPGPQEPTATEVSIRVAMADGRSHN